MMELIPVIGLEMHCEMKSATKVFSKGENTFNDLPNLHVNKIDMAFPGILPVVNMECMKKAIEMAKSIPHEFDTDVKLNATTDLAYARSISRASSGNSTYNIPVNITFTGNIDSSTNIRKLAEELAQETQYQLAGMGLTG